VDFKDPAEALPAFLTVAMMPLTFSIANGIAFGLVSFIVLKLFTGHAKQIKPAAVIVAALFVLQYVLA
jgi:AGZA family xanthine/uracil permease-like MFS transporter